MLYIKIISLGCPKNQVDSEYMRGLITNRQNTKLTSDPLKADVIIINTCGFINDAKEESIDTILEAVRHKEKNNCQSLIVTGCLTQRYQEEIFELIPEIDGILGAGNYNKINEIIDESLNENRINLVQKPNFNYTSREPRKNIDEHYSFVKISEGCNNNCTYCVIPQIRGNVTSRTIEDIVSEVEKLVTQGVKEIILVAQDITQYGIDIFGSPMLTQLLLKLVAIKNLKWLRLLYSYPERITEEHIKIIAENKKICNYLDLPIQHSVNRIRRLMNRQGTIGDIKQTILALRDNIPDIVLRTSLIVGFPGETEQDFNSLCSFVKEMKFERLGVFKYSQEEGTAAARMKHQVSEQIKEERFEKIMALQKNIAENKNSLFQGKELQVLIDEVNEDFALGRSQYDAPDIDNQIIIYDSSLRKGDLINCRIKETFEYDMIGEKTK